ncbi:YheC/YheD family protein [Paenibacillus thalictri]|uniref:YheC/YheD family protein n=1 Tax=Paenibacillus thalictri TaxID=2527873 RepID=A0A4Q9DPC1_9BACL|nr:YheC/YheD family protein [Paenibacillus thalictri]TBL76068.1 YheC/YheD family protein [Paenibacillus thalictri]
MGTNRKTVTRVISKLVKTRLLLHHRQLAKHIPDTRPFTRRHLANMLNRYKMVYVKPDGGSLGVGVVRVEKRGSSYRYQSGIRSFTFGTFEELFTTLKKHAGSRRYLVQKGIHLLKFEGRPFDFRVMIQKNPARQWEPTGTVGRVAHPRKIVTNGSQGSTIYPATDLMKGHADGHKAVEVLRQMNRIARLTAARFSRTYPAINELGLDIAVDRNMKPWILEVNTHPDPCPFTKLEDKKAIRKIVAFAKTYGRRYCLKCAKAKKGR